MCPRSSISPRGSSRLGVRRAEAYIPLPRRHRVSLDTNVGDVRTSIRVDTVLYPPGTLVKPPRIEQLHAFHTRQPSGQVKMLGPYDRHVWFVCQPPPVPSLSLTLLSAHLGGDPTFTPHQYAFNGVITRGYRAPRVISCLDLRSRRSSNEV
jgi:hypothetical protein